MKHTTNNPLLRNIAIIAHVDHGKTTLVDQMLRQSGLFRANQQVEERIMDNMDLERERGITIAAKNCSVRWEGVKINILDTPGHADFGGEVERALKMVDGAILLVDSSEGPLPQTRFVLKKALEENLKIIVVINKIDRKDARPQQVLNEIFDLFIDLDASEEQIEFPVLYAIGRQGIAQNSLTQEGTDLEPLFTEILEHIPAPAYTPEEPFQMLVSDLNYSDYLGRLAIGRVFNGSALNNDSLICIAEDQSIVPLRVTRIQEYDGIVLRETDRAQPGDIIILAGIEEVHIGDTICTTEAPKALKRITVDEPTISMLFTINTSPLSGREGRYVQSGKLRERLLKESLRNVSIRVEEGDNPDRFIVKGRGEFQMAILIETMRREDYELCVGRPSVIMKVNQGVLHGPIEHLFIDCEEQFLEIVTETLSRHKARMVILVDHVTGRVRVEFSVPSRSLIGYRNEFLTDTKGTGIMNFLLAGYEPFRGDFITRLTGSIVSDRSGDTVAYALNNLEPRGILFVGPGEPTYEGHIIGEHNRENDIDVNATKQKKLTNMRSSTKDEAIQLTPFTPLSLEKAIEFIKDDEMVEVTPKSIRLRKSILSVQQRKDFERRLNPPVSS